jgi:hypothetical protein
MRTRAALLCARPLVPIDPDDRVHKEEDASGQPLARAATHGAT